jgi:thiamine biosynthesis lipoprotein
MTVRAGVEWRRSGSERAMRVEHIWGTAVGVDIRGRLDTVVTDRVSDAVFAWFHRVDDLFSTWREDSEISRIGSGDLRLDDASPEVHTVLALCDRVSVESGGAFDITFGADPRVERRDGLAPLDPSGLVKGWALDHAAVLLADAGVENFTINAGGDVITRGRPESGREWTVGIQHPWMPSAVAATVAGIDLAVATSGRYERGEHIIDPDTGRPPSGLMAVTVITDSLALADGYATAAVVLGTEGMAWLAGIAGVEGMGITDARTVVTTPGFGRYRRA